MDSQELLRANLPLVERLVRFVCRRAGVAGADVDDLDAAVKLALVENDYAILHGWQQRASLASYLTVIIRRMVSDQLRAVDRWRPSAEAKRIGTHGVAVEALLHRDARSIREAAEIARLPVGEVERIARRLPERRARIRLVELDESDDVASSASADDYTLRELSDRTNDVLRAAIEALPLRDRMLVRLHFVRKMTLAEVGRVLQVEQRPLYRRLEQILNMLRSALADAGIDGGSAADLIGSTAIALDFGLNGKNEPAGPTTVEEQS
jgi:RNA polymerase sigma factor (sigma-70 family)